LLFFEQRRLNKLAQLMQSSVRIGRGTFNLLSAMTAGVRGIV
jgi:hypothetical protein